MISKYKRKQFSQDTSYTVVIDKKFKTNSWKIKFIASLDEIDSPALSLAASVLSSCNSEEKTMPMLNSKLNDLYGADLFSSVSKRGDMFIMTVGISLIDDAYALENEKLSEEAVKLLVKTIFSPYITDGGFDKEIFEIEKRDLTDSILAKINDKRRYLFTKSMMEIFKGEPASKPLYGTVENAEKLTPQAVYKAYCDFLNKSIKEIYFEGTNNYPESENILKKAFSENSSDKQTEKLCFDSKPNFKEKTSVVKEELNVSQSKFLIALKNKSYDKYTMRMLSAILGGIPSSKLFSNVREKQSLCYYCTSSYNSAKSTLLIDCGVDLGKEQAAIDAVMQQIEEIKKGNITDEEMNAAILAFDNSLKSVGDVQGSYTSWYFECFCSGEFIQPDVSSERYHNITKEMVKNAASDLVEDTVYIICQNEKEML